MQTKFDEADADDLINIIRRRRPNWHPAAIKAQLGIAANRGASLGEVTSAAEKAMHDPKAKLPPSILWPEFWGNPETQHLSGTRLCVECTRHFAVETMTKRGKFFYCGGCLPAERQPSDSAFATAEFNQGTFMERTAGE
jgi:hypothetical protein